MSNRLVLRALAKHHMKTIEQKSNFGQFSYTITAEIGDEVNAATTRLAIGGLADAGFRAAGSSVEKGLVEAKLIDKDTKRADISYGEETARKVESLAQAALDKLTTEKGYPKMTFVVTGQHEYGESNTATKEAEAVFVQLAKLVGGEAKAIEKLGVENREAAVLACKAKLQEQKKAAQAAALESLVNA